MLWLDKPDESVAGENARASMTSSQSIHHLADHTRSENDEEATLVAQLCQWGICYLTGASMASSTPEQPLAQTSPELFLRQLAGCHNARVRDAIISLLLLHPNLASAMRKALQESTAADAEQLSTLTLAALYLQRLWRYQLTLAFGHPPALPEHPFAFLWQNRSLPEPAAYEGRWGLAALERQEQRRVGIPLTFQGDWQNQVEHLLIQERAKQPVLTSLNLLAEDFFAANPENSAPIVMSREQEYGETMRMRPNVDRPRIERFLTELGRRFRQMGRLYLVGGAALVHAGVRPGSCATTQEIDVEAASGDMYQAIG